VTSLSDDASPPTAGTFQFEGTVLGTEILGARAMTITPVHFDPRFALIVRVSSVNNGKGNNHLQVGEERAFGIHSPSRMFRGEAPTATVRFEISWALDGNSKRFSNLRTVR